MPDCDGQAGLYRFGKLQQIAPCRVDADERSEIFDALPLVLGHLRSLSPKARQVTVFNVCAKVDAMLDLVGCHCPDIRIGMGHNDPLHANLVRLADKRNALFRRGMSCRKDYVRLGTYFHYPDHFRQDLSVIVQHRNAFLLSSFTLILVGGIQSRHPDAAAQSSACLDRLLCSKHIHPVAVHPVHAETAEALRTRQCLTDDVRPVVATKIVGLEHHGTVASRHCVFHKAVFIHRPLPRIRAAMQVDIAHAFQ